MIIEIPSSELPNTGDPAIFDGYVMLTEDDYQASTIKAIEQSMAISKLEAAVGVAQQEKERLQAIADKANDEAKQAKAEAAKLEGTLRLKGTAVIKAKKELEATLKVNKNRSDRIAKQQKEVKRLAGEISSLKKQLADARKRFERDYIDESKPTITIGKRQIVVQFHEQQIHVYDPANHYVVSSQPLPSEKDYTPRFSGYAYPALLDNHHKIRQQIKEAINALAMGYRKAVGKVLVADIRNGVSPTHLKKVWNAGIMFAADLEKPEIIAQVKELPGIGPKTLEKLLAGAKAATKTK